MKAFWEKVHDYFRKKFILDVRVLCGPDNSIGPKIKTLLLLWVSMIFPFLNCASKKVWNKSLLIQFCFELWNCRAQLKTLATQMVVMVDYQLVVVVKIHDQTVFRPNLISRRLQPWRYLHASTCLPIFELHYRRFFKNTAVRLAVPWREPNNFNNFTAKFELFFVLTQENASS